jgi:hypothetical protein
MPDAGCAENAAALHGLLHHEDIFDHRLNALVPDEERDLLRLLPVDTGNNRSSLSAR